MGPGTRIAESTTECGPVQGKGAAGEVAGRVFSNAPATSPAPCRSARVEAAEQLRTSRVTELAERLRFDLSNALAGDGEPPTDLFEGVVGPLADAEPHAQHLLLAGRERPEDAGRLAAHAALDRRLERADGGFVF